MTTNRKRKRRKVQATDRSAEARQRLHDAARKQFRRQKGKG